MPMLLQRAALVLLAIVAISEIAHAVAARLYTGDGVRGTCAVLVLGYPANGDGTASDVEVQRMERGAQAMRAHGCEQMVISGGAAHNGFVEAEAMAALATGLGVARERIVLETHARDTKENIALSLQLLPPGARVFIVSNALHALRGRRYFCASMPARCAQVFAAATAHVWWRLPQRLVESAHEAVVAAQDGGA